MKLLGVSGSLRAASFNTALLRAAQDCAPEGVTIEIFRLHDLPLFNQDVEDQGDPEPVQAWKAAIRSADALLLACPEYNGGVTGVLKNAIDWASRPYGKNSFAGKPGALCGTSAGGPGTSMAQQHLKNIMLYLDIAVLGQPEVYLQFKPDLIDADGNITNEDSKKFLSGFVDKYVAWVEKLAK